MINEENIENYAIDIFKGLGYEYLNGLKDDDGRDGFKEVVLFDRLEKAIRRLNPHFEGEDVEKVIAEFKYMMGSNDALFQVNKKMYELLIEGVRVQMKSGSAEMAALIDFDEPENNEFLVINQFKVQYSNGEERRRRPDIVVFVNGIPLGIIEFKNIANEQATLVTAHKQVTETYAQNIEDLFKTNQIVIISDGGETQCGAFTAGFEHFSGWNKAEDENEVKSESLETAIKGVFDKDRFLDIIRNFVIFDKEAKKIARYHQYHGVNRAVERVRHTLETRSTNEDDKKVGVFWHTQGSGKTISMIFLFKKLRVMKPMTTFLFVSDRRDIDHQSYKQFVSAGFSEFAHKAGSMQDLNRLLQEEGGRVIFTTLHKFKLEELQENTSHDIFVIVDEAHRSQYTDLAGAMRNKLPNASFLGLTGTPISFADRDTNKVFGENISVYTIDEATGDGAVVRILYQPRYIQLKEKYGDMFFFLRSLDVNRIQKEDEWDALNERYEYSIVRDQPQKEKEGPTLKMLLQADDRVERLAEDIISHFNGREIDGKGLIAVSTRKNAAKLYTAMKKKKSCPKIDVVLSSYDGLGIDDRDVSKIEEEFKKCDSSLKLVIVCDMWLTGFDVEHLHTLYLDKLLKNHSLLQAIARVNRVFSGKGSGMVVDYVGVTRELKQSVGQYIGDKETDAIGEMKDLEEKMKAKYNSILSFLGVKKLDGIGTEEFLKLKEFIVTDQTHKGISKGRKKEFLDMALVFLKAHKVLMPFESAHALAKEAKMIKALVASIRKDNSYIRDDESILNIERKINENIIAESARSLYGNGGGEITAVDILSDDFVKKFEQTKYKNAMIDLVVKILEEDIRGIEKLSPTQYKSFKERLRDILQRYEDGLINSAQVFKELSKVVKEEKEFRESNKDLNPNQVALLTVLRKGKIGKQDEELRSMVDELINRIKSDIATDWINNESIKARVKVNLEDYLLECGLVYERASKLAKQLQEESAIIFKDFVPSGKE